MYDCEIVCLMKKIRHFSNEIDAITDAKLNKSLKLIQAIISFSSTIFQVVANLFFDDLASDFFRLIVSASSSSSSAEGLRNARRASSSSLSF